MLFCGIDVAKRKHVAVIMDDTGKTVEAAFGIRNNRSGFDQMVAKLGALSAPVTVGLEATGHYWLSLYDELTRQGYPVTVLNPFQVAAYRRSGLRKLKTDASDAGYRTSSHGPKDSHPATAPRTHALPLPPGPADERL